MLIDILRESATDSETYVVSGACTPEAQFKLFKKILRTSGFDEKRFVPLDIRGTTNDGILRRLKETVESLVKQHKEASRPSAAA